MPNDFYIKQNDTLEALVATLNDSVGSIFSLAGATVVFSMRSMASGAIVVNNVAATIVDAANRIVKYQWVAGDTIVAGDYRAEFEVTFSGGAVQTFPNGVNDDIIVHIYPEVA